MRHPFLVLIGTILVWLVAIGSFFNQPIIWWQSILLVLVALVMSLVYVRERGASTP